MLNRAHKMGFTLLELMIIVAILGILVALAAPSLTSILERRKIIAAAEAIQSDLRWTRSEAIKRNTDITITFTPGAAGAWSYTITPAGKTVNSATIPEFGNIALTENFGVDHATGFDHIRGTSNDNGTVTLTSPAGEVHVVLSVLGRARICSVGGNIGGYASC
jgi:type IV fimbrial biogenesis protein FimT